MRRILPLSALVILACALHAVAEEAQNPGREIIWRFKSEDNREAARRDFDDSGWDKVAFGHKWKSRGFAWFRAQVTVPVEVAGKSTDGHPVGLRWNSCDGGECYLDGRLYCRYDNDHPAMIVLAERAKPGEAHLVAVRTYMGPDDNEREGTLGECDFEILDDARINKPFQMKVNAGKPKGKLFQPFRGLSQGGGMADYKDETAAKFREIGIKWVRMDNVMTWALKEKDGEYYYDWEDLDRRVDFIHKMGAEPIFCISYMPIALDAIPDPERFSYPKDWKKWEELVYEAVKRCKDRGKRVKYWEVWNEINTGWLRDEPGLDHLSMYLKMYDSCVRAVKRADPEAWIGGPAIASGPWDQDDKRGPGVNGEKFMRGLMKHCEETGAPLDFVTWHEYFQPWWIMKKEAEQIREYMNDYPKVKKQVKELQVTEWNFTWWSDLGQDNEVGAAWCANTVTRAWVPARVDKPCFFYAKDGDMNFRGSFGMLIGDNKPKAQANVCRMFNMLAPTKLDLVGEDGDLSGMASTDPETGRTTVLIVNFGDRYGVPRKVEVAISNLPKSVLGGVCRRYLMDKDHSNIWNDLNRAELEIVETVVVSKKGSFKHTFTLANNGVTLLEIAPPQRTKGARES